MKVKIIEEDFSKAEAILRDALIKENQNFRNDDSFILLKLLKAREADSGFELELAKKICGDNPNYPYRSSYFITRFFKDLGFDYEHDGSTRRFWIENQLKQLDVSQIALLIQKGLFRRKDYRNEKFRKAQNMHCSPEEFLNNALNEFGEFIEEASTIDKPIDLNQIFRLHPSIELLLKSTPKIKDEKLNNLISDAKNRFLDNSDKNIAIEKLWDAFERSKTYFDDDKKCSVEKLIEYMSIEIDKEIIEVEFRTLTKIGNDYRIRHHEMNKKEISDINQIAYLFFRMLSLLDFILMTIYLYERNQFDVD